MSSFVIVAEAVLPSPRSKETEEVESALAWELAKAGLPHGSVTKLVWAEAPMERMVKLTFFIRDTHGVSISFFHRSRDGFQQLVFLSPCCKAELTGEFALQANRSACVDCARPFQKTLKKYGSRLAS